MLVAGKGKATSKRNQKFCRVKLAEIGRIPINAKYMNPRIKYDGINWWITIGIEYENSTSIPLNEGIGIDLGIKDLAICSDNVVYKNINKAQKVKKLEKRKRRLQRSISRRYINKAVDIAVKENDEAQLKLYAYFHLIDKEKGFRIRHGKYLIEKYQNRAGDYLKQLLSLLGTAFMKE